MAVKESSVIKIENGRTTALFNRDNGQLFGLRRRDSHAMWGGGGPKSYVPFKGWPNNSELVMFPIIGAAPDKILRIDGKDVPMAARHGLSRYMPWEIDEEKHVTPERVEMHQSYRGGQVIGPTDDDVSAFPYRYSLRKIYEIDERGRLSFELSVHNPLERSAFPYATGWHPTFSVPQEKRESIRFTVGGDGSTVVSLEDIRHTKGSVILFENSSFVHYQTGSFDLRFDHGFGNTMLWYNGGDFVGIEPISTVPMSEINEGNQFDVSASGKFKVLDPGHNRSFRVVMELETTKT